jgi:hypothetical protein
MRNTQAWGVLLCLLLAGTMVPAVGKSTERSQEGARPVLGTLASAAIPQVGGLQTTEIPRIGQMQIESLEVTALRPVPLYSSRSGDVPVEPEQDYLVLEVPVGATEPDADPSRTRWLSEPFPTGGWGRVTVLVRVLRLANDEVYTTYATRLDVRNGQDMPFFHGGATPLGAPVVAAEGRAAFEHFPHTVEVLGFSIYLSR